jgi:signal transduction histidine kinase
MTGKGTLSRAPKRRFAAVAALHLAWVGVVLGLVIWWERLVLDQARRIALLEQALLSTSEGANSPVLSAAARGMDLARTERMVFWEATVFLVLLLLLSGALARLYWRESLRTRQIQGFFAGVTHELRTPLSSIRLQAESIAEALSGRPSEKDLVRRLLEDTLRLESQVERTLELARVEGGGPVFPRPLRLKPWVERAVESWKEASGARLEFVLSVEDVSIQADPSVLSVVFRNLVENSLRHARREPVRVEIRARSPQAAGGLVWLEVADNGDGFAGDPARIGLLFEKGPASQGAGVGLYLVTTLMKRMGGQARFQGKPGFSASLGFQEARADG